MMGIWFRKSAAPPAERRAFVPPWVGVEDRGYADIDGSRIDTAAQVIAISSSIDLIASLTSELPFRVYSGLGRDRVVRQTPSYLLDPAGDGYGIEDWLYQGTTSYLYRGNLFGSIVSRAPQNYITQMDWLHPDKVTGHIEDGRPVWMYNGEDRSGQIYHRRINPVIGQVKGMSPIARHATTIGTNLAAARFGKSWFDSDAHPIGILHNTEAPVGPTQSTDIKNKFMAALRGNGKREPVVTGRGWEWQQIQIAPEESQLLGTLGYTAAECCRIFGPGMADIMGYQTGGSQTYVNVQDRDLQLLKYALGKWLRRMQRVLFDMLPRPQYAIFERDALLETNTMQRIQAHASALDKGWKVVNEVREEEHLPEVEWGDEPNPKQWPLSVTPQPANDQNQQDGGTP